MNYSENTKVRSNNLKYQRNIRKKDIARRVVLSWLIFCLIGMLIGSIVAWACTRNAREDEINELQSEIEELKAERTYTPELTGAAPTFGSYDGRVFNGEISLDWGVGDYDFTPMDVPLDADIQEFIFYLCKGYNIDFTFVMALIQQESSFNPNAVSGTGDYGLMQINKCNHETLTNALGITDFLDPYQNVRGGMYILRTLFEKYETPAKVLMAYNMGENGASKLWVQGVYETAYSRSVLDKQHGLEDEYNYKLTQKGE